MLPWDHAAVGYLALSLLERSRGARVGEWAAVSVLLGSQFPDLVDKPLAWGVELLPSGTTLAHSVFVAVPLAATVYYLARRSGRDRVGRAFGVGYLLHLPADILYGPLTSGGTPEYGALLWPLVPKAGGSATGDFVATVTYYLARYRTTVLSTEALVYLSLEVALLGGAVALWLADGHPCPGLASAGGGSGSGRQGGRP